MTWDGSCSGASPSPSIGRTNRFDRPRPTLDQERDALSLDGDIPLIGCDATSQAVLVALVRHLIHLREPSAVQEVTP